MHSASRLAIGTAQFGLSYGVSNQRGQIPKEEIQEILARSFETGINTLDTAVNYGNAESQLGSIGVSDWRIVSKIPPMPEGLSSVADWVEQQVHESLDRLKINRLSGLLLHQGTDLLGPHGDHMYSALKKIQEVGRVAKIGVSIYEFGELGRILDRYELDLVQAPFNCIDRRIIDLGWITRLNHLGVEVHVRSIFLQGLLLMSPEARPDYFRKWSVLWSTWDKWISQSKVDPVAACLNFVLSFPGIDRVIIGIDSLSQLLHIVSSLDLDTVELPQGLICNDLDLVNPSRWSR